jgi:CRP/FNR family transcriptional regulator, nitrogen oxide reductase regulator
MREHSPLQHENSPPPTLLSGLTSPQHEMALQRAERRNFAANEVIAHAGKPATRLFQLTKGTAKLYRVTKNGIEVLLWWLAPEDVFGVGALLARPWHYIGTAQAVEDCEVLAWSRDKIRPLSAIYEIMTANALHIAMNALAEYTDRVVESTGETAEQRLARTLVHVARRTGKVRPEGVDVTVTNEDLGSLANISMFTASRLMQKWEREGVIEKTRGKIRIFSPEHLLSN